MVHLMDFSLIKAHGCKAFVAMLGLTLCAGTMRATNLLTATSPVSVSCSTATGPGTAASITVKPATALTGSNTIAVTVTAPGSGLVVTPPASQTLTAATSAAGIVYTVNVAAGCVGASTGSVTVHFNAGGNADVTTTVNDTVTATASGLSASPVTITCTLNG